jgi:hypothetical protein
VARPRRCALGAALIAALVAAAVPGKAATVTSPDLEVPEPELAAALTCPRTFDATAREPVLLVHGTFLTAKESWAWNYGKVLPGLGFDVCTVDLPGRAVGDIQLSSEYVVYGMRRVAELSGRKVDVIGHSQGTLEPRWAIKWWPDLQALVDDSVSLAGPHHGIDSADAVCTTGSCFPAAHQMRHGSKFLAALNAGDETPGPVSVTSVSSNTDELVQPAGTARLAGASNIQLQELCPLRVVHHGGLLSDNATFVLVMDALTNPGPASPTRFAPLACNQLTMPGVDDLVSGNAQVYGNGLVTLVTAPQTSSEPSLEPYATPG